MTEPDTLGQLVGSLRTALSLFAVMILSSRSDLSNEITFDQALAAQRLNALAWTLVCAAILSYSPLHAAWSFGSPAPRLVSRVGDLLATSLTIASCIILLAARGTARGLSRRRVRSGLCANLIVLAGTVGVTWSIS